MVFYWSAMAGLVSLVGWLQTGEDFWGRGVVGLVMVFLAMRMLPLRRRLASGALRRVTPPLETSDSLEDRCFVLYLRNFRVDAELAEIEYLATQPRWNYWLGEFFGYANRIAHQVSREYRIVRLVRRFGLVVAVGNLQDDDPFPSGAVRYPLPHHSWKSIVARDMRRARLVLMMAGLGDQSGSAESTLWEYAQAVRSLPPERFLLLVCGDEEHYERFRSAADSYLGDARNRRSGRKMPIPQLPNYPALHWPDRLGELPALRGIVSFGQDWTGHFTRFDPTKTSAATRIGQRRETERDQINPLMDKVEERLPGTAVRGIGRAPRDKFDLALVNSITYGLYFHAVELVSQKILVAVIGLATLVGTMLEMKTAAEDAAPVKIDFPLDR
ncbi:hypothetical protein [Streptomyces sp. NPDC001933]|uniref:hypothetical protein n=1 Tax=Streptomyces sp. NPDC001933 TaxID=3364626 RepID=UPI00367F8A4D